MATETKKDGRLVLGRYAYGKLRQQRYKEQNESCAECGEWCEFWNFELHHTGSGGRGLGGGKRDDRATIGLCSFCHRQLDAKKLYFSGSQ